MTSMFTKAKKDLPGYLALSVLLILACLARVLWLGNIPGINGDEAWFGVQMIGTRPVTWFTPTGLFLNPFFIIPLWIFQRFSPPAFWVLRMPAVLSGLLLLALGYFLLKKQIGVLPALIFVALAAGLPDLIVYARFGWDPSETGLAMLIVFYFALSRKWGLCLVAVVLSLIIQPTNIFALAILIIFFGAEPFKHSIGSRQGRRILGALGLFFVVLVLFLVLESKRIGIAGLATDQLFSLPGWLGLFASYGDLISGVMLYRYISTPIQGLTLVLHDLFIWVILLSTIILGCWYSIKRRDFVIVALVGGLLVSLVGVHITMADANLLPYNRYLQFLIVPTLLLVTLSIKRSFSKANPAGGPWDWRSH